MKREVKEIRKKLNVDRKLSRERGIFNWLLLAKLFFSEGYNFCNRKLVKKFDEIYAGGLYFNL